MALISPDGQYVLYHTPPDPGWSEIRAVRLADGRPVDFRIRVAFSGARIPVGLGGSTGSLGRARWTPDGRGIAYIDVDDNNRSGVMLQDFAPGRREAEGNVRDSEDRLALGEALLDLGHGQHFAHRVRVVEVMQGNAADVGDNADTLDAAVEGLCKQIMAAPRPARVGCKDYARSALDMDVAGAVEFARSIHAVINSSSEMLPPGHK